MSVLSWPVYTLADAYTPRPPLKFCIDGIFMQPSLNVVYGAPGSLKSMLMADACICVALGEVWLPNLIDTTRGIHTIQSTVLWIDFDNGKRRTDERFDAIGKAYGAAPATPLFYVSMPQPWLDLTRMDMVLDLIGMIQCAGAGFVVIDNLGVVSGDCDENTTEMIQVMGNLRMIAERTSASITVIHHQRKMQGKSDGRRQGDALRGHSSIEASLDLALQVEREVGSDVISVVATKARGADVRPFGAMFTYDHIAGTTELAKARFWGTEPVEDSSDSAIEDVILEAIEESDNGYLTQTEIVKAVQAAIEGVGRGRIRTILALMETRDVVKSTKGKGRSHALHYSIPQTVQHGMPF